VVFDVRIFSGSDVLITGGLSFIGSSLARRLVGLNAKVTLIDSLIPEYGGNLFNINDIRGRVIVDLTDVRDAPGNYVADQRTRLSFQSRRSN